MLGVHGWKMQITEVGWGEAGRWAHRVTDPAVWNRSTQRRDVQSSSLQPHPCERELTSVTSLRPCEGIQHRFREACRDFFPPLSLGVLSFPILNLSETRDIVSIQCHYAYNDDKSQRRPDSAVSSKDDSSAQGTPSWQNRATWDSFKTDPTMIQKCPNVAYGLTRKQSVIIFFVTAQGKDYRV